MRAMSAIRWTPQSDIPYYSEESGKVFVAGREYVGLPYTMGGGRTTCMGDPLGIFKTKLEDGVYVGPTGPNAYYGSDCSSSVEGAWRLAGYDTGAIYTGAMIPGENESLIAVGDYDVTDRSAATQSICVANGEERLFACYALLQKGDAVVRRVPSGSSYAGHVRMVVDVDKERQTVTVIEQCGYGIDGQTTTTWRVDREYTFASLFANRYIPISPFKTGNLGDFCAFIGGFPADNGVF